MALTSEPYNIIFLHIHVISSLVEFVCFLHCLCNCMSDSITSTDTMHTQVGIGGSAVESVSDYHVIFLGPAGGSTLKTLCIN